MAGSRLGGRVGEAARPLPWARLLSCAAALGPVRPGSLDDQVPPALDAQPRLRSGPGAACSGGRHQWWRQGRPRQGKRRQVQQGFDRLALRPCPLGRRTGARCCTEPGDSAIRQGGVGPKRGSASSIARYRWKVDVERESKLQVGSRASTYLRLDLPISQAAITSSSSFAPTRRDLSRWPTPTPVRFPSPGRS